MKAATQRTGDLLFYLIAFGLVTWHALHGRWDAALFFLVLAWFVAWLDWTRSQKHR